jgi:hypothetical protein
VKACITLREAFGGRMMTILKVSGPLGVTTIKSSLTPVILRLFAFTQVAVTSPALPPRLRQALSRFPQDWECGGSARFQTGCKQEL